MPHNSRENRIDSRGAMRRPTVTCPTPRTRAAPDKLPARATARKAIAAAIATAATKRLFRILNPPGGLPGLIFRLLLRWLLAQCAARQLGPIGQHDFAEHAHGRALLAGNQRDGNLVAGMQSFAGPARSFQNRRRERRCDNVQEVISISLVAYS